MVAPQESQAPLCRRANMPVNLVPQWPKLPRALLGLVHSVLAGHPPFGIAGNPRAGLCDSSNSISLANGQQAVELWQTPHKQKLRLPTICGFVQMCCDI